MIDFKKIPLQLGSQILLRSLSKPSYKAKSRIIGVLEKEFIMIEEPVYTINNPATGTVKDDFLAVYLHEGRLFTFKSHFHKTLINNMICIDYPKDFQIENLRREERIKVNLDAVMTVDDMNNSGFIKDLSYNGCLFQLSKIIPLSKGTEFAAAFSLHNNQQIKHLQCTTMSVRYDRIHQRTGIGSQFSGPEDDVSKIRELVRFCMRFKL
jgi:hypothetical protein